MLVQNFLQPCFLWQPTKLIQALDQGTHESPAGHRLVGMACDHAVTTDDNNKLSLLKNNTCHCVIFDVLMMLTDLTKPWKFYLTQV